MSDSKVNLSNIKNRFQEESESIKKYIDFMEDITSMPDWSHIDYIFRTLLDYKIYTDCYNEEEYKKIYSEEPNKIVELLKKYYLDLQNKIKKYKALYSTIPTDKIIEKENQDDIDKSVLTYITMGYEDLIEKFQTLEEMMLFFEDELGALITFQKVHNLDFIKEYNQKVLKGEDQLIRNTFYIRVISQELSILGDVLDEIEQFEILDKMQNKKNILNIYRQGFILLVSGFDAVVFDMVKLLMYDKFFEYIDKLYNKDKNMKMKELGKYGDFNSFKDNVVNEGLKGKYIKDLIEILKELEVDYIVQNFSKLMECLNRRNVHLHNQGKVDKKYMEKFNIYGLNENEIAQIDEIYLDNSYKLYVETINSIYEWINSTL